MDIERLEELFQIGSMSGFEDKVIAFVERELKKMNVPYEKDEIGNIYNLRRKNLPILNAHMDSVQDSFDYSLAPFAKIRGNNIISGYGVIGGDDKCGLFIILELLKTHEFNFIITVQEEVGLIGIKHFLSKKENDISEFPWALTLDRRGNDDIICDNNDYGTRAFENDLVKIGAKFGYSPGTGTCSDADEISEFISCANISVGYYDAHNKTEFVILDDLKNALDYTAACIEELGDKKYEKPEKTFSYYAYEQLFYEDEIYGYGYSDDKKNASYANACAVTNKKGVRLYYIPSLDIHISKTGARILFEDLEESGAMYAGSAYDEYDELEVSEEEINELIKEFDEVE